MKIHIFKSIIVYALLEAHFVVGSSENRKVCTCVLVLFVLRVARSS